MANVALVVLSTLHALAITMGSSFLYAIYRDFTFKGSRNKSMPNNEIICLALVASQILWSTAVISIDLWANFAGGFANGWLGNQLCYADMVLIIIGCANSGSFHLLLAFERYYYTMYRTSLSNTTLFITFVTTSAFVYGTLIYQSFSPSPAQIYESGSICFFPVRSDRFQDKIAGLAMILYAAVCMGWAIASYGYIFYIISSSAIKSNAKSLRKSRAVLLRCVGILALLLTCWGPVVMAILYRIITNNAVHPAIDALSSGMVVLDGSLTSLLLLTMQKRYWEAYQIHVLLRKIDHRENSIQEESKASESRRSSAVGDSIAKAIESRRSLAGDNMVKAIDFSSIQRIPE